MRPFRSPLALPIAVLAVLIVVLAAGAWEYFQQGKAHVKRSASEELGAIADLKVREILEWRRERLNDAAAIAANPFNTLRVIPFLEGRLPASEVEGEIRSWMDALVTAYRYTDAVLLDRDGNVKISAGRTADWPDAIVLADAVRLRESKTAFMSDFHRTEAAGEIHLDLYSPVVQPAGQARESILAGLFMLRIDPGDFIYPLIQNWPVPSSSAESLLVQREGEDVLFLNDLRHRKDTAMSMRFPATAANLPAAMAVRGVSGFVEGTDYRGARVISVIRPVAGTPWFMIAKEDLSEVLEPLRLRTALLAVVLVILIFGLAVALLFWIKRREAHYYRKQYEIERDRLALVRHFEYLHKYANDIIFLTDREHRVVEANERARLAYGYTIDELKGMRVPELRAPEERPGFEATMREAERTGGLVFETRHRRKDGTVFPVEVSLRILDIEGVRYHQAIIRDISERRKAEEGVLNALREKDVLLREIHHRVKNNMQVISSLLSLQAARFPEGAVREAFHESQDRIRSMALVHEKLYQTRDLSRIDFAEYIRSLTSFLFRAYKTDEARISLKLDLERTFLDINTAIPCGLILNELVLNALKHAFPDGRKGQVRIGLQEAGDGTIRLTVRDDGVGFPEGIDIEKADSLGLQIVSLLAGQIDGRIEVRRDKGTNFSLTFKLPKYDSRI